jgi:hypothetical protein
MSTEKIDYDRGVIIRTIPEMGMDVFMYRDNPGVYLNAHGDEVGIALARMAHFDVEKFALQRRRRLAIAAAASAADAEMLASEKTTGEVVVLEKDGYKIVMLSAGRHVVKDPEGNVLTQGVVLTLEMAKKVLEGVRAAVEQDKHLSTAESPAAVGVRAGVGRSGATALRPS